MEYDASRGGLLVTLGQFAAWVVTAIGAVIDALYVREAILSLLSVVQAIRSADYHRNGGLGLDFQTGFAISAIDDVVMLILGCGAIAAVVAIEYYYRKGRPKGLLLKRIGTVVGIEVAILVISMILRALFAII